MSKNKRSIESFAEGYSLGIKFFFILACPILSGAVCGIWLDQQLQTTPLIMLALLLAGFTFGVYAVYRIATRTQAGLAQERSKKLE